MRKTSPKLFAPGEALENITPIFLLPYAPDHNPTERVWNAGKQNIANLQRDTAEETFSSFMAYITNREFNYLASESSKGFVATAHSLRFVPSAHGRNH
jgi:hypothetical protein